MRISRCYLNTSLAENQPLTLDEKTSHYLLKVLRLKVGAELVVFNGDGHDYQAQLVEAGRRQATVQVGLRGNLEPAAKLTIHLGIGLSRAERFDYALQKATELGVNNITPLFSEYVNSRPAAAQLDKKQLHWQGIIQSACEQSGRSYLPTLHAPVALESWLQERHDDSDNSLQLVLVPGADNALVAFPATESLTLLVGPEGGLSDREIELAGEAGFQAARLGRHVLRTETAPVAAIAIAQALWGDYR